MRSELEVTIAIEKYADLIRRICMVKLKNHDDTEDIFQNVFLKYALCNKIFESVDHEKAWFIRVTINACKDLLKSFFKSKTTSLAEIIEQSIEFSDDNREILEEVLALPEKYRDVVYLYYYEGYTACEIAAILKKNVNTIYTNLTRARKILRERLGDIDEE